MRAFLIAVAACSLLAAPASAQASKHPPKRKGGEVRRTHTLPKGPLARFLARQVGPVKAVPKARHRSLLAYTSAVSPNFVEDSSGNHKLYLARSYDIPADDPAAVRLANLSWTYDSAITAIAFVSYGAIYAAQELLDQLKALQRTDGSLDFAYDVSNGDRVPRLRTTTCKRPRKSPGTGPVCRPKKSLICVLAIMTAMPLVNPTTTGRGMNFTAVPNPVAPRMTRMTPAISVHMNRPSTP